MVFETEDGGEVTGRINSDIRVGLLGRTACKNSAHFIINGVLHYEEEIEVGKKSISSKGRTADLQFVSQGSIPCMDAFFISIALILINQLNQIDY